MGDAYQTVRCRPCQNQLTLISRNKNGATYWCRMCGTVVEIDREEYNDRIIRIVVDRCDCDHRPMT